MQSAEKRCQTRYAETEIPFSDKALTMSNRIEREFCWIHLVPDRVARGA